MPNGILSRVLSEILGFGVGQTLANALAPEAEILAQLSWSQTPIRANDLGTLATLVRLQRLTLDNANKEANKTGYDKGPLSNAVEAQQSPPGISEILELARRGRLDPQELRQALARSGLDDRYIDQIVELQRVLMSPQDLAMARQQGFVGEAEQRTRSELQGVVADDADLMFELSGLPLGLGEAMELLRRGHIDEPRFAQMLREGHTKTKYTDDALKLRFQPLSASVAAEALIRERMTEAEAVTIAEQNGISREDFLKWSNMLGRPIATGEALTLANRGQLTLPQFREAVARSDVRTEYTAQLWELRTHYPPLFQVIRMLTAGTISDDLAHEILVKEGYTVEVVTALIAAGHKDKTQKTRDLAASQLDILYESGLETEQWATDALVNLGYDAEEASLHLSMLDARRILSALNSQLNVIHRTYVGHKISRDKAVSELDGFGIGDKALQLLLDSWDAERAANVSRLTNAQIGTALKNKFLTLDEALARWQENGYPLEDARILAEIATKTALTV